MKAYRRYRWHWTAKVGLEIPTWTAVQWATEDIARSRLSKARHSICTATLAFRSNGRNCVISHATFEPYIHLCWQPDIGDLVNGPSIGLQKSFFPSSRESNWLDHYLTKVPALLNFASRKRNERLRRAHLSQVLGSPTSVSHTRPREVYYRVHRVDRHLTGFRVSAKLPRCRYEWL